MVIKYGTDTVDLERILLSDNNSRKMKKNYKTVIHIFISFS